MLRASATFTRLGIATALLLLASVPCILVWQHAYAATSQHPRFNELLLVALPSVTLAAIVYDIIVHCCVGAVRLISCAASERAERESGGGDGAYASSRDAQPSSAWRAWCRRPMQLLWGIARASRRCCCAIGLDVQANLDEKAAAWKAGEEKMSFAARSFGNSSLRRGWNKLAEGGVLFRLARLAAERAAKKAAAAPKELSWTHRLFVEARSGARAAMRDQTVAAELADATRAEQREHAMAMATEAKEAREAAFGEEAAFEMISAATAADAGLPPHLVLGLTLAAIQQSIANLPEDAAMVFHKAGGVVMPDFSSGGGYVLPCLACLACLLGLPAWLASAVVGWNRSPPLLTLSHHISLTTPLLHAHLRPALLVCSPPHRISAASTRLTPAPSPATSTASS